MNSKRNLQPHLWQCQTLNRMAEIIQEEFKGIKIKHIERNSLVPERGSLNVNKARDLINYKPTYNLDLI